MSATRAQSASNATPNAGKKAIFGNPKVKAQLKAEDWVQVDLGIHRCHLCDGLTFCMVDCVSRTRARLFCGKKVVVVPLTRRNALQA